MQKHINRRRKEISIIAAFGAGSDNGKLNRKRGRFFKIIGDKC